SWYPNASVHIYGPPYWRSVDLEDAADDSAIGEHIEVVIIPLARRPSGRVVLSYWRALCCNCCCTTLRSSLPQRPGTRLQRAVPAEPPVAIGPDCRGGSRPAFSSHKSPGQCGARVGSLGRVVHQPKLRSEISN